MQEMPRLIARKPPLRVKYLWVRVTTHSCSVIPHCATNTNSDTATKKPAKDINWIPILKVEEQLTGAEPIPVCVFRPRSGLEKASWS